MLTSVARQADASGWYGPALSLRDSASRRGGAARDDAQARQRPHRPDAGQARVRGARVNSSRGRERAKRTHPDRPARTTRIIRRPYMLRYPLSRREFLRKFDNFALNRNFW